MTATTSTRPGPLPDAQYSSLQRTIESALIDHADIKDVPEEEADNALRLLVASSAGLRICEDLQRAAVHKGRQAGRSWAELGALMGITRQAAQQRFAPSAPKEWFVTEWVANVEGHEILVRNSWNRGIRLFVDEQQVAESQQLFALDWENPILSASIPREKGKPFLVEVFAHSLFSVRVKIVVDGKQVGGEVR